MARRFKNRWTLLIPVLAVLTLAVACSSAAPEPTATPVPAPTPVPTIDLSELGIDTSDLDTLGITEADLQCLAVEVEAEVVEQLVKRDLTPADALSVLPALQACNVELAQLISGADDLLAESLGDDYAGLDSLPFTADQLACLVMVIDAESLESLVGGEAAPDLFGSVLPAFGACGVDIGQLIELASGVDLGSALDEMSTDDIPTDLDGIGLPQLLPGALDGEDISGIVETDDLADIASDLPFTAEQFECLSAEIELDNITALAAGEINPITMLSFIGTLTECGVNLADLAN